LAILGTHSRIHAIPTETRVAEREVGEFRAAMKRFDLETIAAGKRRWVEKTPRHIHSLKAILDERPDAKILLIVRDGRDVACSIRDRGGSLESGIARWIEDNEAAREYWSHPNVHLFKYEDLVGDFEGTMRRIMDFLGEEFEPALRNFHEKPKKYYADKIEKPDTAAGQNHNQYRNWQINQPLFDGRGRWQKLSSDEQAQLQGLGASMLAEFGYMP
jgi:hypothetical protein